MRFSVILGGLLSLLATGVEAAPRLDHHARVPSQNVEPRDITVWVPDACQGVIRCSVLYMMDGQNVFTLSPYSGADWGVADALPKLMAEHKVPPTIVVAVDNIEARTREYMPQRVYDLMPTDYQARIRAFEGDQPPNSDAFLKFLVTELKPFIDKTYPTVTGPEGTVIMGSSMGGHIALYAQGEYPDVFGASASLSMPWLMAGWAKDAAGVAADRRTVTEGWRAWLASSRLQAGRNRIYTDQGTLGLDDEFTPYMEGVTTMFLNRGWDAVHFQSRVFPGTKHSEKDWRKRIAIPLVFVLNR
ncbi:esterase family protein [Asticcacaulis biprosthecium C19]|uniref:Esterase family protein n=1 Tax=Asticcacaulis biprosthecium C19 TaxID=715226 RepID=F4QJ80_9CAUL|nr:alpha/beta hydrolase-fold protein [Asticcacaulis biprosthecium]EGF91911.1 esterase family protein [Asticcacaulis biprosthecium C19]